MNGDGSVAQQNSQIAELILKKVDVLAVDAASETAVNGIIEKACKAGIIVVSFDSVASAPCNYQLNFDFKGYKATQAEAVFKMLGGKGNVIQVRGVKGSAPDNDMFSGFCAAIVGLIISSELMASHPATGESFELNAIAAAVLGGTSMSGGRGTIGGTIVGAFVIGILSDGLVMMGVSSFWQMVIKGLVIIVAVVVDQAQRRLQQRVTLMQMAKAG